MKDTVAKIAKQRAQSNASQRALDGMPPTSLPPSQPATRATESAPTTSRAPRPLTPRPTPPGTAQPSTPPITPTTSQPAQPPRGVTRRSLGTSRGPEPTPPATASSTPPNAPGTPDVRRAAATRPLADALDMDRILEMPAKTATPRSLAPRAPRRPQSTQSAHPSPVTQLSSAPDGDRLAPVPPRLHAPSAGFPSHMPDVVGQPERSLMQGRGDRGDRGDGMQPLGESMHEFVTYLSAKRRQRESGGGRGTPPHGPQRKEPEVCPRCGGAGYVRRDVPVGDPTFGQPVPCECKERELEERRRREEERRLLELDRYFSLMPFAGKTFETFTPRFNPRVPGVEEAYDAALRFAQDPDGWLLLKGGYGTGKSHLAAAIAHTRLAARTSVFFAVVPDLLDHLRAAFAPTSEITYDEMFDTIRNVELLVLDDFGAENSTAWATEKLFQIINHRYNQRIPTVITTNDRQLSRMDERIRSRLSDLSIVHPVDMGTQDYRRRLARRGPRQ